MSYSCYIPSPTDESGLPLSYNDPRRSATAPEIFEVIRNAPMPTAWCSADVFAAAKDAAISIIESGSVGGPDKAFYVVISGHANPDHEPCEGWVNDCVTVSVTQATVSVDAS